MRCPKCDWTTVSYEMESGQWQCKRCRALFKASKSSSPGWLKSSPAKSTVKRSAGKSKLVTKRAAKAKPARRTVSKVRKPKIGAKTRRSSTASRRGR